VDDIGITQPPVGTPPSVGVEAEAVSDTTHLRELGYEQTLKREFGFWHAAAIGFADISPIVAMYGMFALALAASGPTMFWGLFLVLGGMTMVALVFGEISSHWPLAGGVYQWTRQQVGTNWAWFGGWAYMWTMVLAMTTCSYAAASYVAAAIGWAPSRPVLIGLAMAWIAFGTFANTIGQIVLKVFVTLSIGAEFIASLILGTILLVAYRVNPLSVLTDSFGTHTGSTWNWVGVAWLGAVAFIGWSFLGYEASGAIAEEVKKPERTVPWTILIVLLGVGAVVIYTSLAWILALPNIKDAMTGGVADPMVQTLEYHLGNTITKPILVVIAIGFTASMVALQTVGSRTLFSFGRDRMIPGHRFFTGLTDEHKLPARAIVFVGAVAIAILFVNLGFEKVYGTLVSFVVGGFYVSFLFPVAAALVLHLKRKHKKGPFNLGAFSLLVTILATLWLGFEFVNICWPRYPELPWYQNWGTILMIAILGVVGFVAYLRAPSHESTEMM
jgi:amino acid transporter